MREMTAKSLARWARSLGYVYFPPTYDCPTGYFRDGQYPDSDRVYPIMTEKYFKIDRRATAKRLYDTKQATETLYANPI